MFEAYILPILVISITGLVAAVVLVVASKVMAVKVDEKFETVRACLPGVNCGACGFAGCDEYAHKVAEGAAKTNMCVPGGDKTSREISEALGVEFEDVVEQAAFVRCSGDCNSTDYIMDYQGKQTCEACNTFYQGRKACSHACLGFGDCVVACKYDAIHIVDGVAVVDREKCTGCGMCAKQCPNHLIMVADATKAFYVGCSSTDKGAFTRKICQNGCIGCKKCERTCQHGAITVNDNLASINTALCVNCGECKEACPTGAIRNAFEKPECKAK